MKESVGYTVILNIVIVFITIIFAFITMSLNYYRAYKVSNAITSSIEKYEGYNSLAEKDIELKLTSLGYNKTSRSCAPKKNGCRRVEVNSARGSLGYCVYYCSDKNGYYHYKTLTNMLWNIPIIGSVVHIDVETNTEKIYDFGG